MPFASSGILLSLAVIALSLTLAPAAAHAQTAEGPAAAVAPALGAAASPPRDFLPDSAAAQARAQREGDYGDMVRPGMGGGQIQGAFDTSRASDAVYEARDCRLCVYKVRTREFMISTVILPNDVKVVAVDIGDPAGFEVKIRSANVVAVRPMGYGMDTSMTVHAGDGRVYPFYVRAEGFNSKRVPDLVVRVNGGFGGIGAATPEDGSGGDGGGSAAPPPGLSLKGFDGGEKGIGASPTSARAKDEEDFVERVEFDPATLHGFGDYRLWGSDELRPETVFRDRRFTYLQYGDAWDGLDLPGAYVVVDGIDELVNTRVQGRTYTVESTAKLIALKSGLRHLCVEYAPDGGRTGPRNPGRVAAAKPWDRRRGP